QATMYSSANYFPASPITSPPPTTRPMRNYWPAQHSPEPATRPRWHARCSWNGSPGPVHAQATRTVHADRTTMSTTHTKHATRTRPSPNGCTGWTAPKSTSWQDGAWSNWATPPRPNRYSCPPSPDTNPNTPEKSRSSEPGWLRPTHAPASSTPREPHSAWPNAPHTISAQHDWATGWRPSQNSSGYDHRGSLTRSNSPT